MSMGQAKKSLVSWPQQEKSVGRHVNYSNCSKTFYILVKAKKKMSVQGYILWKMG